MREKPVDPTLHYLGRRSTETPEGCWRSRTVEPGWSRVKHRAIRPDFKARLPFAAMPLTILDFNGAGLVNVCGRVLPGSTRQSSVRRRTPTSKSSVPRGQRGSSMAPGGAPSTRHQISEGVKRHAKTAVFQGGFRGVRIRDSDQTSSNAQDVNARRV